MQRSWGRIVAGRKASSQRTWQLTLAKSWRGRKQKETLSTCLVTEPNQSSFVCNCKQLRVILGGPFYPDLHIWMAMFSMACYRLTKDDAKQVLTLLSLSHCFGFFFPQKFLSPKIFFRCPRQVKSLQLSWPWKDTYSLWLHENKVQWQTGHSLSAGINELYLDCGFVHPIV